MAALGDVRAGFADPCRCYDEYFSPSSIEEMNTLGIEGAP
jgi:hypothetical protein